jgi:hypothetical protein
MATQNTLKDERGIRGHPFARPCLGQSMRRPVNLVKRTVTPEIEDKV